MKALAEDKSRLQSTIRGLERELAALRREVNHRDDIIRDRVSPPSYHSASCSLVLNSIFKKQNFFFIAELISITLINSNNAQKTVPRLMREATSV